MQRVSTSFTAVQNAISTHRNKDEWSGFADLLADLIEKYASVLDIDNLPEPMYYLNDEETVNNVEYSENGVENTKTR